MKFSNIKIAIISLSMIAMAGCTGTTPPPSKQQQGAGVGAFIGSVLGYGLGKGHSDKELAIIAGAIVGGLLGNNFGAKLDDRDRLLATQNMQYVLESNKTGQASEWKNPDSGAYGETVPTKTFKSDEGQYCREFQTEIRVDGKAEQGYGTACRQDDGSWKIVG